MILAPLCFGGSSYSAITATTTPSSLVKLSTSASGNTGGMSVSASGGSGSYTYLWSIEDLESDSGTGTLTPNNPTAISTSFAYTNLGPLLSEINANIKLVITDTAFNTLTLYRSVNVTRSSLS